MALPIFQTVKDCCLLSAIVGFIFMEIEAPSS